MPCPRPIRRQFRRWSGVASARRGNQASGAASSRPSASTITTWSSVTVTSVAVASSLITTIAESFLRVRSAAYPFVPAQAGTQGHAYRLFNLAAGSPLSRGRTGESRLHIQQLVARKLRPVLDEFEACLW